MKTKNAGTLQYKKVMKVENSSSKKIYLTSIIFYEISNMYINHIERLLV